MMTSRPSVGQPTSARSTTATVLEARVPSVGMVLIDAEGRMHDLLSPYRHMSPAGARRRITVITWTTAAGPPAGET